ncbi:hypothetical protein DXG01_002874 [Tephrocybe rancida]|nr:hypothetical protein DXG01_002874 [Tephrocybe rancida]
MLGVARKQYMTGKEQESKGNIVEAYEAFVMAASLIKETMERGEGKGGLLSEIQEFSKGDLGDRLKAAEDKLKAFEQTSSVREATGGTSIADRKKALEDNGLSLGGGVAQKRISRAMSEMPPPSSPKSPSMRLSPHTPAAPPLSPSAPTPPPPSPRTLISASSFAPPSPPTSPVSFAQAFPPIEEIEAPFNALSTSVQADTKAEQKPSLNGASPAAESERPPSTPNPSTTNPFYARSGSPPKPSLPRKPSNFSIFSSSTISQYPPPKRLIPVSGTITPEELSEYAEYHNILLLDVRTKSELISGHILIRASANACIDPSLLRDEKLTLSALEQVLPIPSQKTVFQNRDKFEIVVLYDNASTNLGATNSPLSILSGLLADALEKRLKRQPMLLVGGFNAWKNYLEKSSDASTVSSEAPSPIGSPPVSTVASNNPFYVNGYASPPTSNQGFVPGQSTSPLHRPNMSLDYGFGHASNFASAQGQFSYPTLTPLPSAAPIEPSQLSRKRTDYDDPSQDAVSDLRMRTQIAYPTLSNPPILQPPPPVASSALERQDTRPRPASVPAAFSAPQVLRMQSNTAFRVQYWSQSLSPVCGLENLGNTCYMNATLQCLYATAPFMSFFKDYPWEKSINMVNTLGTRGQITKAFETLLKDMWAQRQSSIKQRLNLCLGMVRKYDAQYEGFNQHDSQEFLTFLLDKMHEDLNRVLTRPAEPRLSPQQELALEQRDPRRAIDEEWEKWQSSNDSVIVDLFQGQFKNRLQCSTCTRTSTTYNAFSILQLSIPLHGPVPLQKCLDNLFHEEELKGDNRWDCPSCKAKRNATKRLSLARLPPILVIHLKRFQTNGRGAGKIDTFVQCPTKYLEIHASPDMPDETQGGGSGDPRTQVAPYKYELYGVTNHHGQLNSGHYTAHIHTAGDWYRISDTNISRLTSPVVTSEAYVLFYKRVNR